MYIIVKKYPYIFQFWNLVVNEQNHNWHFWLSIYQLILV